MIRRYFLSAVALLIVAGFGAAIGARDQGPSSSPVRTLSFAPLPGVALLATNSIIVENAQQAGTQVSGDIIVNGPSSSTTLEPGTDLDIAKDVAVAGDIYADSAVLNRNAIINGTAFVDDLTLNTGVQVTGGQADYAPPIVNSLPSLAIADIRDDATSLNVPVGKTGSLDPDGSYTSVTIEKGGTLVLSCGSEPVSVFHMVSLTGGESSTITYDCPVDVRVQGRLFMGKNSSFMPTNSLLDGSAAVVSVEGDNADPDNPLTVPLAVEVGRDSTIVANVHAPNGTIKYNKSVASSGMLLARDIWLNGPFITESAFINEPPVANDQGVATVDDPDTGDIFPLVIKLTGNDPEGEVLTFSIVSGPTEGALTNLTQLPPNSAEVTYTASTANNLEDVFTFQVADPMGLTDTAQVFINPSDPIEPPNIVIANDFSVEILTDNSANLRLRAVPDVTDPGAVGDLSFAILSGPTSGALSSLVLVGTPVRSATTTYTPDLGFNGPDSFVFEACGDLNFDGDTADLGECDTATVSITVGEFTPPPPPVAPVAENRSATAVVGKPTVINLGGDTASDPDEPSGPHKRLGESWKNETGNTETVDFEQFAGATSVFTGIEPPLRVGSATFSGGQILDATTFLPADPTVVYGTADFCPGCLDTITIDFTQPVSNLSILVLNGLTSEVTYFIEDDQGNVEVITLEANFDEGAGTVTLNSPGILMATVTSESSTTWDFFIDDVTFFTDLEPGLVATITFDEQLFVGTLLDSNQNPITSGQTLADTTVIYVPPSEPTATPSTFNYVLTDQSTGLSSALGEVSVTAVALIDLCAQVGRTGTFPNCVEGQ